MAFLGFCKAQGKRDVVGIGGDYSVTVKRETPYNAVGEHIDNHRTLSSEKYKEAKKVDDHQTMAKHNRTLIGTHMQVAKGAAGIAEKLFEDKDLNEEHHVIATVVNGGFAEINPKERENPVFAENLLRFHYGAGSGEMLMKGQALKTADEDYSIMLKRAPVDRELEQLGAGHRDHLILRHDPTKTQVAAAPILEFDTEHGNGKTTLIKLDNVLIPDAKIVEGIKAAEALKAAAACKSKGMYAVSDDTDDDSD